MIDADSHRPLFVPASMAVHPLRESALILIDLQVNMFEPSCPVWAADRLLAELSALLERARAAHVPIIFVRNCGQTGDPDERGSKGWELHPSFCPGAEEVVLDKTTSDTFASTALDAELQKRRVTHLVIAGLQSEFCVKATVLGAWARNYEITLVADGHSTFDGKPKTAAEKSAELNEQLRGQVRLAVAKDIQFV